MNMKSLLAELWTNRNLPMSEYKQLSAFVMLEKEGDIVERIAVFHLPEITKLICGSNILSSHPWAKPYAQISEFYSNPDCKTVITAILDANDPKTFENEILAHADVETIQVIEKYYNDLNALLDQKRKTRANLSKKINSAKKKEAESAADPSVEPIQTIDVSEEEDEKEMLAMEIKELDAYIKKIKRHFENLQLYLRKAKHADSDENRSLAYHALTEAKMSVEEAFLKQFIASGVISENDHAHFHDQSFVGRLLQCLEKGVFKDYAFPILLKLYDEGAIDLVEGAASEFIIMHPEQLCEYLIERDPSSIDDFVNSEIELLIEKAIQIEICDAPNKQIPFFSAFWNTISDRDIWRWIITKTIEIADEEVIDQSISCLLYQLNGRAAKALVEALFDSPESGIKVSTTAVISALMRNNDNSARDVIVETIRLLEQQNRKVQRKLNTSERKLRSQSQELFSSVYLPMEQLEELAINLRLTTGDIKASLVATHLIDLALSLREGFESLNLQPLVDAEDWKYQRKIAYDSSIHHIATEIDNLPDVVKLKSLGFRYQDDDGEWQQYNARVYTDIDSVYPKRVEHQGRTKGETTTHKRHSSKRYHTSNPTKVSTAKYGSNRASRSRRRKR